MSFQKYKSQLLAALEDKPLNPFNTEGSWHWFIKGDVSGIQDFIFSVKSDKASKQLKARSQFVEKRTEAAITQISKQYAFYEIYNGGGNFYGLIDNLTEEQFTALEANLNRELIKRDLYLATTKTPITQQDLTQFDTVWKAIQMASVKDKFKKYHYATDKTNSDFDLIFDPYGHEEKDDLIKEDGDKKDKLALWSDDLQKKYADLIKRFKEEDKDKLPKERIEVKNNNIIEFRYLAAFAKLRTGTEKIAVMKMDVDFLGDSFNQRKTLSSVKALSESLKWFFNGHFEKLLENDFNTGGDKFQDNIYVVFAGGDDCFMVGAWDAVFEFAKVIRESFKDFTNDKLRLSASLTLIDEKYPVIRFARLAEDALKNAKEHKKEGEQAALKNRISVFNHILEWDEFYEAQKIAYHLADLINNHNESRSILDRIKKSRIGFEKIQDKVKAGFLSAREIWRLKWFIRGSNNKEEMKVLLESYDKRIVKDITSTQKTNPMIFPIAARWAEFLTKK
jgi:CRISPR-associated protein Csm1